MLLEMKKWDSMNWLIGIAFIFLPSAVVSQPSYGSRLGFGAAEKLVILHVDDVGMSFESNQGAMEAIEKGVASSWSIMMPCPWVPQILSYLQKNPMLDAGLHLTLTSEWKQYRWGPLSGKPAVPGLVDSEGAMYSSVKEVVQHASPSEVYTEIKAQLDRSMTMGWKPTHFDSHMGTLMADERFLEKYIQLGVESGIPIMLPVGHCTLMQKSDPVDEATHQKLKQIGEYLWNAGLPVIDDLHNMSYGWKLPASIKSKRKMLKYKVNQYIESFKELKPGVTFVISHCSQWTDHFDQITNSGPIRWTDLEAWKSDRLKRFLKKEGIRVTTWRELSERRKNSKS
jgi:chitin disaccharide deacetylase